MPDNTIKIGTKYKKAIYLNNFLKLLRLHFALETCLNKWLHVLNGDSGGGGIDDAVELLLQPPLDRTIMGRLGHLPPNVHNALTP